MNKTDKLNQGIKATNLGNTLSNSGNKQDPPKKQPETKNQTKPSTG